MNFYTINRGLYKRLHKYFVYQSTKYSYGKEYNKKIKKLKCKPLTKFQKKEISNYYAKFGFKNINTNWHRLYTHISGVFHKEYIPPDFFYNTIEPSLNMKIMFPALMDKNLLDKLFTEIKQPETIVKNINGFFVDGVTGSFLSFETVVNKCKQYSDLVIKPSIDSGGGKNVIIFKLKNNLTDFKKLNLEQLLGLYDKNFIIQKVLVQNKKMSLLNPDSVNTLRIKTLIINSDIVHLSSHVRVGGKGSRIDNSSQGGLYCLVDDKGFLFKKGYTMSGDYKTKTDNGVVLEGFQIPNYPQIESQVLKLHMQIPHFRMISWDIAIDEFGALILLEYNVFGQGYSEENGPLFGDFTDEVLNNCEVNLFSD